MFPGRCPLLVMLATLVVVGCGAPGAAAPTTVEVRAAAEEAPPERPRRPPARRIDVARAPAPSTCPKVEPRRVPCFLIPNCNGTYGSGNTRKERDCNKLMYVGYWTEENEPTDPIDILAWTEGVVSELIRVNGSVEPSDSDLRAAVARYVAVLRAEKEHGYALAQAICAGEDAQRDAMLARLRADLEAESKETDVIWDICRRP